jgi:hypothetical protein
MSSTYSTNLAIELMGAGDQAGNWGSTTNTNLGTLIEQAISGYVSQAVVTGTDTTITIPNGATGVARNMFIQLTGSGGASTNLIVPANKKLYFIYNATASGQVTVKVSGQTGVSVPNGAKVVLVSNGTDIIDATNYMSSLTLGSALPVASGGTGGTTSTGSGAVVLATSPTLVTPALGTPASGVLTNCTGTATGLTAGGLVANAALTTPALTNASFIGMMLEAATITASAPSSTTNYDALTQTVQYYTSNANTNFTFNIRGNSTTTLNASMTTGQALTLALLVTNGSTAYYPSTIQVDGTTVTPKWQNGASITGGYTNSTDVYVFTVIKTASATYTVLGTQTKFA